MIRSLKKMIVTLTAGLAVSMPVPAGAVVAAAPPGAAGVGYATTTVVTTVGGPIEFVNADIDGHNFTAYKSYFPKKEWKSHEWCASFKKTRCPVFWSATIGPGQTAVQGLDGIEPGEYTFYCTIHPSMQGTLRVVI